MITRSSECYVPPRSDFAYAMNFTESPQPFGCLGSPFEDHCFVNIFAIVSFVRFHTYSHHTFVSADASLLSEVQDVVYNGKHCCRAIQDTLRFIATRDGGHNILSRKYQSRLRFAISALADVGRSYFRKVSKA